MGERTSLPDNRRNGRNATVSQVVNARGQFHSDLTPLARFAEKCRFEPSTGCVVWIGGKSNGGGKSDGHYGVFKDAGVKWYAHRWAAVHIHGFDLSGGLTVGHCCKNTPDGRPNPLCVEHVKPETLSDNIAERNMRVAKAIRAEQSSQQRLFWLFVNKGIEPAPAYSTGDPDGVPWFDPPAWLKPFLEKPSDECPF